MRYTLLTGSPAGEAGRVTVAAWTGAGARVVLDGLGLAGRALTAMAASPAPVAVPEMPAATAEMVLEGGLIPGGAGARCESANGFGGSLNGLLTADVSSAGAGRSQGLPERGEGVRFRPLLLI